MKRVVSLVLVVALLVSTVGAPAVAAQSTDSDVERAELKVYQPHYASSGVNVEDAGNRTIYKTTGREIQLQPTNFNSTDVVSVEIEEDVGSIAYDQDRRVFVFDSDGTSGTFTINWVVREQEQRNVVKGNTTETVNETVTRTYSAILRTSKTDLAHIPTSRLESLKTDAENWSEAHSLYASVGNPNKPVADKMQFGARLVQAWYDPVGALSGDFGMAIQAIFFSAGGLIFFVLWNIPHLVRSRKLRKENKELKEKIGDYEQIDDALDKIFTEKRKRYLKEKVWNEWFDDKTAYWLRRNLSPEPWSGGRRLMAMLSPAHLNAIVAGAMLDSGRYVGIVEYDPDSAYSPDGGEVEEIDVEKDVVGARVVAVDDVADQDVDDANVRQLTESDDLTEEIADQFDPGTLDSAVLLEDDVDLRDVALPIGNTPESDDFVEELNVSIPEDFETREHFADVIMTIIEKVAATDYTDVDGQVKPERDLANFLIGFSSLFGEAYGSPYFRNIRDLMLYNLDRLDATKRTEGAVREVRDLNDQGEGS